MTVHHPNPGIHNASGYLPPLLAPFRLEGQTHLCCYEIFSYSHERRACFRTRQLLPTTACVIELFHFLNASQRSFKAFSLWLTLFPGGPLSSLAPAEDNAVGFKQYFILKRQISSVQRLLMDTNWDTDPLSHTNVLFYVLLSAHAQGPQTKPRAPPSTINATKTVRICVAEVT